MTLGNEALPIPESFAYPPQFTAENSHPVRTQNIHYSRNLGASPPEFAIARSKGISLKLNREHAHPFILIIESRLGMQGYHDRTISDLL